MKLNIAAPDAFVVVVKVMNHTWLWNSDSNQYSLNNIHQIYLYGLGHSLRICSYRPTWPCMLVKVLTTQAKFIEPSDYCTVINCAVNFCTTNDFGFFHGIMAQFEFVEHKLLNWTMLYVHLCSFQIKHRVNQCRTTKILPTLACTYQGLNYFSHVIYTLQNSSD